MKSTTESGYGARIGNAESLLTAIQGFSAYQPVKPELSTTGLGTLIAAVKDQNTQIAVSKQNYSLAVDSRLKIFEKQPFCIKKVLSPINATIKVIFGSDAKEVHDVAGIISKIRGANARGIKKTDTNFVSQSYQSFHSKIQFFADLLANLGNFGTVYSPTREELLLHNLQMLYVSANNANQVVMDTYSQFIQKNDLRLSAYESLSRTAILIKESIKAQYGYTSSEYNLIKKLKI